MGVYIVSEFISRIEYHFSILRDKCVLAFASSKIMDSFNK